VVAGRSHPSAGKQSQQMTFAIATKALEDGKLDSVEKGAMNLRICARRSRLSCKTIATIWLFENHGWSGVVSRAF
jgi:hypothetical protein